MKKMSFKRLPEPCKPQDGSQMVFCIVHAPHSQPWSDYEALNNQPEKQEAIIPVVIQMMRWDGWIGNPGGFVDADESLQTAMLRELKEELNFEPAPDRLRPLISHQNTARGKFFIHCFECEVSEAELRQILKNQHQAEHYFSEGTAFAVQLIQFPAPVCGLSEYMQHNFKATAKIELQALLERYSLT